MAKHSLRILYILILFIIPLLFYGKDKVPPSDVNEDFESIQSPWTTGPLLASSANVIPGGKYNLEPYLYAMANTGVYDRDWHVLDIPTFWSNQSYNLAQIGITSWLDIQFAPVFFWNYCEGKGNWAIGDLPVIIDFQLYKSSPDGWFPSVKLGIQELIPLGKYRNLDPKKRGTDLGGFGSWNTEILLVLGRFYHIYGVHFFAYRLSFQYTIPAPVNLKGFNAYGGGHGTKAHLIPSHVFQVDLGMEYTLTRNWVLALDIVGNTGRGTRYSGFAGTYADGSPAILGRGRFVQYSLAPAIEYNWSSHLGVIAGSWFTIAGKRASSFCGGILALDYYY